MKFRGLFFQKWHSGGLFGIEQLRREFLILTRFSDTVTANKRVMDASFEFQTRIDNDIVVQHGYVDTIEIYLSKPSVCEAP